MTGRARPALALVICTFHREALLARLILSLAAEPEPRDVSVSVIVVDNSDAGTAQDTIEALRPRCWFDLRRIEAHPPNISIARNVGVAAADGADFVAFLDDDTEVVSGWLAGAASAIGIRGHDAFFGPNLPDFEATGPVPATARAMFTRDIGAPLGHELVAWGPRRTRGMAFSTSNTVVRRAALAKLAGPFDVTLGRSGGEDVDLFYRLHHLGARMAWVPQMRVREAIPVERCQPAYLRERCYAGGQAFAGLTAAHAPRPRATLLKMRARALIQLALLGAQYPFAAMQGRASRDELSCRMAAARGKLAAGRIIALYERHSAANGH